MDSNKSDLVLIAAVAGGGVIGSKGSMPWNIKEDMARFKALTLCHPVLMGKATYFSIPDKFRPLRGRENFVLTKNPADSEKIEQEGARPYSDINLAINDASLICPGREIYVIGGQNVYEQTIRMATRLEITEIDRDYERIGDAFFPEINQAVWREQERQRAMSEKDVSFVSYVRYT